MTYLFGREHVTMLPMVSVTARDEVRSFVGREAELAALEDLVTGHAVEVVYIHGIAGAGKSALLREFLDGSGKLGATAIRLDCRTIEPTERGFLHALGSESVEALADRISGAAPVVLALDHVEVFRLMDTWLRQILVPALRKSARLILAGREPPVAAWFASPGFQNLPLGPLGDEEAQTLLVRRGVRADHAQRLNRIARGHPLALVLASAGAAEHPELGLEEAATARVVSELTRLYLEDVDDPLARQALDAASVVRTATDPLLAAMLEGAGRAALDRLLELPFVEAGRDGLVVHEAVRDSIAGFLRVTNPVTHRRYRRAAWRELRSEVGDAAPAELWRYTADMLYLIENPVVREAFFPSGAQPLAVEPARADAAAAVSAIAARHEGPEAAALLERWWAEAPGSFSVCRDRDGVVTGFFSLLETRTILPPAVDDPIVAAWARHLRDQPVPKGQVALGLRRWLDVERGELPCATQAACWIDVKRAYMSLRPALRRMYVVVRDVPTYWPVVEKLGFRPIAEASVQLDGVDYTSVALDFGPGSVDGWLAGLVATELGVEEEPALDSDARELSVNGERVALTPLEYRLFAHLREREGRTVSRSELLREVWGTTFTGGSNVVDAVVGTLRSKLGSASVVVETIRGSGYRLRRDWRAHLS